MRITPRTLADGREIVYYDTDPAASPRETDDLRDLPAQAPASEMRRDPLTGEWVGLAAHRQTRTYKPPADSCPLCPSAPGRPSEIPEHDYEVVVFENRFPSFAQVTGDAGTASGQPMVPSEPARGRCEVVCFTPEHTTSFGQLSLEQARTVVDVWAERTRVLSATPGVEQVFCFENRGEDIGVTLHHPHGQIYGYPFVTPKTATMLRVASEYFEEHGMHVLGDVLAAERASGERVVVAGEHWTAFVPAAARWPVEVQVVPHRRVPDLVALTEAERDDFVAVQLDVLRRFDALYDAPLPYIAAWHQAPVRTGRELSWLFLELFSVKRSADKLKYLAGSESGMRVWINDVTPEQIAERLRAV